MLSVGPGCAAPGLSLHPAEQVPGVSLHGGGHHARGYQSGDGRGGVWHREEYKGYLILKNEHI